MKLILERVAEADKTVGVENPYAKMDRREIDALMLELYPQVMAAREEIVEAEPGVSSAGPTDA